MERIRGMRQYQETELKLRLTDDSKAGQIPEDPLLAGMRLPDSFKDSQIDTTYYDTPGRSLLINGLTLRVRDTGETTVATVKDAGTPNSGLYVRGEWNKILGDDALSADTFAEFPIGSGCAGPSERMRLSRFSRRGFSGFPRNSSTTAAV